VWLCLAISAVTFTGFSITYFGPILKGQYRHVTPAVHVHGWTFFLWYLLLPFQAGLVASKRTPVHRSLGLASVALAVAMVATGVVVVSHQMELARQPNGDIFWRMMGPAIFGTLVLFTVFYSLAFHFRRKRDLHRRFIILASTGALGAAAFRLLGAIIGFGPAAAIGGIFAPNLFLVAAMVAEKVRGERVHPAFRWGLPVSFAFEAAIMLLTPTAAGQAVAGAMAWVGRLLGPVYAL